MRRPVWSKAIAAVLKNEGTGSPASVLAGFDRLIDAVRRASEEHVSDWELGQALSLRAQYLEGRARFKEALAGHLAVAALRRGHLLSNGHSLASTLEAAVSAAIRAGRRKEALGLAAEVIKLRGDYPYASGGLEDVVRLLRDEETRRNKLARRQQLRRSKGMLQRILRGGRRTRR